MNIPIPKKDLLGTGISACTYEDVIEVVMAAAKDGRPLRVTSLDAHGLSRAARDRAFRRVVDSLDIVTPDGTSLRWGLNRIHRASLPDRVAGPDLMLRLCERAAAEGVSIFLYGSHGHVVEALSRSLGEMFPGLAIAGWEPSRFRPATPEEDERDMALIRGSGARLAFVGLGCPLQEQWVSEHAEKLGMPLLAVGAAFDFHSGNKPRAPRWMREAGLEWIHRIGSEPRRLLRRSVPAVAHTFLGLLWQSVAQ